MFPKSVSVTCAKCLWCMAFIVAVSACEQPTEPQVVAAETPAEEPAEPEVEEPQGEPEEPAQEEPEAPEVEPDPEPDPEPEEPQEPAPEPEPQEPALPPIPEAVIGQIVIYDNVHAVELEETHTDAALYRMRVRVLTQYHIDHLDETQPDRAPFGITTGGEP